MLTVGGDTVEADGTIVVRVVVVVELDNAEAVKSSNNFIAI